jgi:hypothetical protein
MPDAPLVAHSLAEAYLYLMATPCHLCGKGPLRGSEARPVEPRREPMAVTITVTCGACQDVSELLFELPHGLGTDEASGPPYVNPTDSPSRIIDVARWITLFRVITEAAARETDKMEARRLGLEAAQCLEEALKFYDDPDSSVPPPEAFFHESSRRRFRANPEQFAKERLIGLRAKLPSMSLMRSRLSPSSKTEKKSWWKRWK